MGFRTGAYAKVWKVEPYSDTSVKLRISISRKNKQSGEYDYYADVAYRYAYNETNVDLGDTYNLYKYDYYYVRAVSAF